MKACPFCAEDLKDEAIKCKHCGSSLVRTAAGTTSWAREVATGLLGVLGAGTLAVSTLTAVLVFFSGINDPWSDAPLIAAVIFIGGAGIGLILVVSSIVVHLLSGRPAGKPQRSRVRREST